MIYPSDNTSHEKPVHIYIGEEEWKHYSFQNKVRLLYRIKQSSSTLAKEMAQSITLLIEEEQKKNEIDYEATIKKYYKDVN